METSDEAKAPTVLSQEMVPRYLLKTASIFCIFLQYRISNTVVLNSVLENNSASFQSFPRKREENNFLNIKDERFQRVL
jgi:hypothetical protein